MEKDLNNLLKDNNPNLEDLAKAQAQNTLNPVKPVESENSIPKPNISQSKVTILSKSKFVDKDSNEVDSNHKSNNSLNGNDDKDLSGDTKNAKFYFEMEENYDDSDKGKNKE
eukprot:CAMPEP_0116903154 /NCGR_PEP_ID=MMETSP0467-20121206/10549_1 /TAXON_ID=283647 /ORGANISM="Mesodinium pulex, Strain SPMC105" /LENGTH=111 /DNA_ID=CAMNT_0004577343 /DNA_START=851 /DNA_END=1186 /DNA_ORIENTATION=+